MRPFELNVAPFASPAFGLAMPALTGQPAP